MAEQQPSAPLRARTARSRAGLDHVVERHSEQFTVVGNHLAQHAELSLTAIGLATHMQSLPDGARVGIKSLAAKFPEGETRIAAALRELEAHGYLSRAKERLPSGRIVTRTTSYNKPRSARPAVAPARESEPAAPSTSTPVAPPAAVPPLPEPEKPDLERHRTAAELLAGLRALDPRLLLTERDVCRLTPAVAAWLERGMEPAAVRGALVTALPREPLRHPAGLLAHRLAALLLPPLPDTSEAPRPAPFQTCEGCDRAFRAREPGQCRDCGSPGLAAA
ncbi:helix-turn-helix domain-containing protein [Streptomyces sp. NBC_01381]|uniref:helix-turn-helix domain-containing protein n=1 Tax=Streptomyces sp. NBC_01381 TaxID=2903845 RepID=UPI00224FF111|nr:helix-turn-helix domain-containing protein [Streptomyces sp. NBC_01381]MCX4666370.1 helix-turn-helix domain-containing protein [Streptomyces sp. NBC_01381]